VSEVVTDDEIASLAEDGAFVRDGWLGGGRVVEVARALEALRPSLRPAGVGRGGAVDPSVRGDRIALVEADLPGLSSLFTALDGVARECARAACLTLVGCTRQVALYPGGGARYARHVDAFRTGAPGPVRRLTTIYYPNVGWGDVDGGELVLALPSGERSVLPAADRLVVFLSERVEHEVLPSRRDRWAVTAWYIG
jgi:SM-20-related protein